MKSFRCRLIDDGIQKENFVREGNTLEEVKDGLEMFQWPEGVWEISVEQERVFEPRTFTA